MKRQKPWTRQEAVLLLDGYLRILNGSSTRQKIITEVSSKLRTMAVLQGEEIDDVYRNENGISFQLASMESAYLGHTVRKPASALFVEIVHLYRTDPEAYSKLLSEARAMTYEKQIPSKEAFFAWLSLRMTADFIPQYQNVVYEIDKYCSRNKKIGTGLFDLLSLERVSLIQSVIESDTWYRLFHKNKLEDIKQTLQYISQYLQELEEENARKAAENQTLTVIDEPDAEEKHDNQEIIDENAIGESKNTPAATTEAPTSRKKQKTYYQDEKEDFYLWLGKDEELTDKDRKRIVSSVKISEMFLQDNISPEYALFSTDVDLVRKSISALKSDATFKAKDEEWKGKYYRALERLSEYNNERDPNFISPIIEEVGEITVLHEEPATIVALEENIQVLEGLKEQRRGNADRLSDTKADKPDNEQPVLLLDANNGESAHIENERPQALPLPEKIEEILRKECKKNHYGTTVNFIKGQLSKAGYIWVSTTEIKRILAESAWAKQETGAWKYISSESETTLPKEEAEQVQQAETSLPPENSSTSQADNEPRSAGSNSMLSEMKRLDFENLADLSFSKPQKLVYFGTERSGPCAWKELYLRFFEALYEDYPQRFRPGMSFLSSDGGKIDLGSYDMYLNMRKPRVLNIDGQQLLLETNLSAEDMARRMKKLLDRCDVDYENVEILYSLDGAAGGQAKEQKPDIPSPQKNSIQKLAPTEAFLPDTAKTKFVRTAEDQAAMKADPETFRSVYYALKEQAKIKPNGITATDIFLALEGIIKRKQIVEVLKAASWAKAISDYSYLFYDEQREEKKQQQTEEKAQNTEQEFFAWLPTAVPPTRVGELKRNTPAIDAVLQQKKYLPQPLFLTTKLCNVEAAEIQARRKLPSQKQRDMASELLRAYAAFLREKKKPAGVTDENGAVRPQKGWIRFDYTNAESFYGTVPVYCSLDGQIIEEKNWARVLVAIINNELTKSNPALQSLYKHALIPKRDDRPFLLKKAIPGQNCIQLSNGFYINVNFVIPRLMEQIQALCLHCGYNKKQVVFYGLPRQMRPQKEAEPKRKAAVSEQIPLPPEAPLYSEILSEKFVRGFRIGSGLDMKKFKRYYEEKTGSAPEKTDAQIEGILSRCGIRYDEKVFVPAAMLPADLRDELFGYIRTSLNSGKPALYYEAIFKEFSERFLDHYIYSADMLKSYIAYYNNGEFYLDSKYLSREAAVEANPFDDVKEYLLAAEEPVESDQICRDLSHLPQKTVMWVLGSNAEFVNNGVLVANGSNSYFFIDIVELTDEDLDNIAELIQTGIEEREFLSGNELIDAIRARYPHILESNAQISPLGMRDAIKYRLKDRFSFNGNVISRRNQAISMADVFGRYAKDHPEFTISELTKLAEEMKSGVYFDDVYAHALRVDAKRFVSKDLVHFQVAETDAAIENACSADYFPLKVIQSLSFFPDAGYPWNTVLLESYAYSFSRKYQLLHAGFNRTTSVGALVKRSSGIDSFDALLARALADSTEKLDKEAALEFFVRQGYLARRIYSNMEAVLLEAKTIRNKKGMD